MTELDSNGVENIMEKGKKILVTIIFIPFQQCFLRTSFNVSVVEAPDCVLKILIKKMCL